jgi:hypothetical protein
MGTHRREASGLTSRRASTPPITTAASPANANFVSVPIETFVAWSGRETMLEAVVRNLRNPKDRRQVPSN